MKKSSFFIVALILATSNFIYGQDGSMPCNSCPGSVPTQTKKLKIYFDGYNGYRPDALYIYSIDVNGVTQSRQFSTTGSWTFTCPITQSFGDIKEELRNTTSNTNYFYATTTYSNYYNNNVQLGEITKHWFDTWNGKEWYYYAKKVTTKEWHFWIGN